MGGPAGPVCQTGSHGQLVSQTERRELDAHLTLDAIIVPTLRTAQNLERVISLAPSHQRRCSVRRATSWRGRLVAWLEAIL